jgi:TIR domain
MSDDVCRYDAFISYSHVDREWVDNSLVPPLELAGLRIAIDHRDFAIGAYSQENMENYVDASRHVVIVLSPSWVKSEWSNFEFLMASADDPLARRRKIIPLLIAPTELPKQIKIRTYADLRDPSVLDAEMKRIIWAISDEAPEAGEQVSTPLEDAKPQEAKAQPASANWQSTLADLVVRSGKTHPNARTALCIDIGLDPDDLTFMTVPGRAFATELIASLEVRGNTRAILAVCAAIRPILKGSFAESLDTIEQIIRERSGTYA